MTVYVDIYGHMVADSLVELHEFAESVGVNRCWFHSRRHRGHPHYDLPKKVTVSNVIAAGAIITHTREIPGLSRRMK